MYRAKITTTKHYTTPGVGSVWPAHNLWAMIHWQRRQKVAGSSVSTFIWLNQALKKDMAWKQTLKAVQQLFFLDKTIYQELGILSKNYDDKIDHKWGGWLEPQKQVVGHLRYWDFLWIDDASRERHNLQGHRGRWESHKHKKSGKWLCRPEQCIRMHQFWTKIKPEKGKELCKWLRNICSWEETSASWETLVQ